MGGPANLEEAALCIFSSLLLVCLARQSRELGVVDTSCLVERDPKVKEREGDSLTLKCHRRDGTCAVGWEVSENKRLSCSDEADQEPMFRVNTR